MAILSALCSKQGQCSGKKSFSRSKDSLAFFFCPFYFFFVVFLACLCCEASLLPLTVHDPCAPTSCHPQVAHLYSARKKITTAVISHPFLETQPSSFPLHKPHFAFLMPVPSHSFSFLSEAFQRIEGASLFTDSCCNVLCNLLAKAPFQTEMRVVRPKMSSLITDIHCWHLSSVCHGWRRREMEFREPEIQESVTLKPPAECNVLKLLAVHLGDAEMLQSSARK